MNSTQMSTTPSTLLSLTEAMEELNKLREERFVREDGALTAREWQAHWGVGKNKVARLLRELVACGKMTCYSQPFRDVSGRINTTIVYKVVPTDA